MWKQKVHLIAASVSRHLFRDCVHSAQDFPQLPNVPFRIFAAAADDEYRKPMLGMLHALKDIYISENVEIGKFHHRPGFPFGLMANNAFEDMTESYFVGDAAGRPDDHSGTDRKWAMNAGLKFYTPEVRMNGNGDCRTNTVTSEPPRSSFWDGQRQNTGFSDTIPHQ